MVTTSLHVPGKHAGAWLLLVLLCGCPATGDELNPKSDEIFFPTGLALSPDESVLFVGSANAELLYNAGTVVVADLDAVEALLGPWQSDRVITDADNCYADPALPWILECHERVAIRADAGVRIGNFSTALDVQELDNGDLRLFVAVRGDPSVTWIDYSAATGELACGDSDERIPLCDGDSRLVYLRDDLELPEIVNEPFGVYVDSQSQYAMITHLALGAVSLVDAPADGQKPMLADIITGLFAADDSGSRGAVGVAGRQPGSEANLVYVTSRSEDRVQMLYVHRPVDGYPVLMPSEHFFLDGVVASDDSRGIAFNADGTRAFIVNRQPPTLQIIDTSLDLSGFPRNDVIGAVEICADSANVTVADAGRGERAYVTCFPGGQVWVVDPQAQSLEAVINVGRGPHALVLAPDRKRLFVANYLENVIAVVDLTPGAPTENRVIMRLGHGKDTGDE